MSDFTVEIDHAGSTWRFRPPPPLTARHLSTISRPSVPADERAESIYRFLRIVLAPESLDQLEDRTWDHDDSFDIDELSELVKALVTAGSDRPYPVVAQLCVAAAVNWTTVRAKLVMAGTPDPLRQLPTVYALCDVVELMILQSLKDDKEREEWRRRTYMPSAQGDPDAPPPGWSEGASF